MFAVEHDTTGSWLVSSVASAAFRSESDSPHPQSDNETISNHDRADAIIWTVLPFLTTQYISCVIFKLGCRLECPIRHSIGAALLDLSATVRPQGPAL